MVAKLRLRPGAPQPLDDARIEAIVQQVMAELRQGERVRHGPLPEPAAVSAPPQPRPSLRHADNLFPDGRQRRAGGRARPSSS